jgi:phytoene dehydrogenase-like protein
MKYDCIVVGGGISGLTASAYLSKDKHKVLLIEKQDEVGGLVSSFPYKGFTFDGGIRAIENSGIVFPMLRHLGIEVDFIRSIVTMGIKDDKVSITKKEDVSNYQDLLKKHFPDNVEDIDKIFKEIFKIMDYMDILYGIDNPLFLDIKEDMEYFRKTIFPWMFKFLFTFRKVSKRETPYDDYLSEFTDNQALIDIIGQHFFRKTPAFFALSYFSLYLDYNYPKGGTSKLVEAIADFILEKGGTIQLNTSIQKVDPIKKVLTDQDGNTYEYEKLIWSCDNRLLYNSIDYTSITKKRLLGKIRSRQREVQDKRGGDSILTTYYMVDMEPSFFEERLSEHSFYTPKLKGLSSIAPVEDVIQYKNKADILAWVKDYFLYNTFELSIPVLRDESLAPKGQTGLIISMLFDYDLIKRIEKMGFYKEFKEFTEEEVKNIFNEYIFKGFKDKVIGQFSSTPLTIEQRTNNTDGAITGWAFTNPTMPAVRSLIGVSQSVKTPIPDVYQSGAWSYSPAGLPVSIMTGKLASDQVTKKLKKKKK